MWASGEASKFQLSLEERAIKGTGGWCLDGSVACSNSKFRPPGIPEF